MDRPFMPELIVYYEGEETGGVTKVIENIVHEISSHYNVKLVYRNTQSIRTWAKTFSDRHVEGFPIAVPNRFDILGWFDVVHLTRLSKFFQGAPLIHFHLHTPFACLPVIFLAKLVRSKSLLTTEHYITQLQYLRRRKLFFPLAFIRELKLRSLFMLKRLSFKCLDRIITVSQGNRDYLMAVFGPLLQSKVETILNGVEVEKEKSSVERKSSLPNDLYFHVRPSHFITVVAALNNQKGHEYLLRALPDITRVFPQAVFIFVGDGHLRQYLQGLAQRLGVTNNVLFTGARSDVARILSATDIFVLPSLFEGMPMSVLEAMAAGKAIVATNVSGTAEAVEQDITGFLVPSKNSQQLAEKIVELLGNEHLRSEFGRRGRERVIQYFSLKQMCRRYLELYTNLLAENEAL
jgi:glycosyltransferase involved in cell wall biosynthesis